MTHVPYNLIPTPEYERSEEDLSRSAKRVLKEIKEAIADDPDHYPGEERHDYEWGTVVRTGGVVVSFAKINTSDVLLLEVMDELSPPPWFLDE